MSSTPSNQDDQQPDAETMAYLLAGGKKKIEPASGSNKNAAADVIRRKLDRIYADEPDVEEEIEEATVINPQSKHQIFMHELANSGKSLADIQTEWHHYYVTLPNDEKHEVWREF